jgi:hypothetical protein
MRNFPRIITDQLRKDFEQHLPLYPAGDCAHCGQPVEECHLIEFRPRALFATDREVIILVHSGSGHERCENRDTCAERATITGGGDDDRPDPVPPGAADL